MRLSILSILAAMVLMDVMPSFGCRRERYSSPRRVYEEDIDTDGHLRRNYEETPDTASDTIVAPQ